MNKTAIKNFAIWARNKLIADIGYRASLMGITAEGVHAALPQSTGQTEFYDIGTAEPYTINGSAIRQRQYLVELIQRKEKDTDYKTAYKYVIEEVAYTWFNRLIAVRFMEINDYLPSHIRVLSSDTGKLEPDLVTTPFDAELDFTRAEQQAVMDLKNANKLDEVFRLLFIKQCNALNEILPALFEKTNDYTELLLNLSVIDQNGVIYHLVHDIPEEDFDVERGGQVEIIGWLYQYYNTEPKKEAFAKKGKITKEEVPAVTQLFTPDWIVRYMVENSLGRLWVEGHPNKELKSGWRYYLEEAEQEPEVQVQLNKNRKVYAQLNPEDIKIIDPCMGSGHILVYTFDVLMQIYESAGYGQRDAARSILENNLFGLDIDDRAFQMAYFAVLMKARQYNRRILDGKCKLNLYSIQESNSINRNQLRYFGADLNDIDKNNAVSQICSLLDTFKDAKEYGSILTVDEYDWKLLYRFISSIQVIGQLSMDTVGLEDTADQLKQITKQGQVLSQKYHVTITNPPYMNPNSASRNLNEFAKKHYPDSKTDLFAIFIERCSQMNVSYGFQAMITMHAWMFLSSYENLRKKLVCRDTINMIHLGARAFEEIAGEVVQTTGFVLRNTNAYRYKGVYCRLLEPNSQYGKEQMYLSGINRYISSQSNFVRIPGCPIAYWVSDAFLKDFDKSKRLAEICETRKGLATSDNNRFLKLWEEVSFENIGFSIKSNEETNSVGKKWYPINKGGEYRRWYGNRDYVINWKNDGFEIRNFKDKSGKLLSRPQNTQYNFKKALTWSKITTSIFSARLCEGGFLFDDAAAICYHKSETILTFVLGFLNTKISQYALNILNPTINIQIGDIGNLPILFKNHPDIDRLVKECTAVSKEDWDSFENSWDFKCHPLVKKGLSRTQRNIGSITIEECFHAWKDECEHRFEQLKADEEKLNQIFIEIYGLQSELSPDVRDNEVTLRRADLQRDIKSLLSYAVGCMFGRYSLESEGLIYAGGKWSIEKYSRFKPDFDNIIPITDEEYLEDDIVSRLCEFLKVAYGSDTLEDNLIYIARTLGNKGESSRDIIRKYFVNDFFKDHCQAYSVTGSGKRPIYWLFDSGKQNGFKALIYLHRYNADTIGNLRIDYLHRMQRIYESEISRMLDMIDHSTNAREVGQATKRRDKLTQQLKECREYDEKLAHLALSRIELDLDDGVKANYRKIQTANDGKFYEVLADSKNIMAKK